jgi:hypothetical protein
LIILLGIGDGSPLRLSGASTFNSGNVQSPPSLRPNVIPLYNKSCLNRYQSASDKILMYEFQQINFQQPPSITEYHPYLGYRLSLGQQKNSQELCCISGYTILDNGDQSLPCYFYGHAARTLAYEHLTEMEKTQRVAITYQSSTCCLRLIKDPETRRFTFRRRFYWQVWIDPVVLDVLD